MAKPLPRHLKEMQEEIEGFARKFGLDFFETVFEVLTYREMNMIASYGGYPVRFPHWKFGMEYFKMSRSYTYGLHRIYEMVINNDPCYAYLLESNTDIDQKLVMAHVYAHCDFFKNNLWFEPTDRKMMNTMANHGVRIRKYMDENGVNKVETFVDTCLSIEDLVDPYAPYIKSKIKKEEEGEEDIVQFQIAGGREYMDSFINPEEFIRRQREKLKEKKEMQKKRFPPARERDVLLFLIHNAPVESWQKDILDIVREESHYFIPQGMTKILNEGWATYWHSEIMTKGALKPEEMIDYADHYSAGLRVSPGRINPYKLGVELLRDIEFRWNTGRFGKEYEECDDYDLKRNWDRKLNKGREKIFYVRKAYNDITFIDEFLTEEFVKKQKMFAYAFNPSRRRWEITSREFGEIKRQLIANLTNFGRPIIYVDDANYKNRGELVLYHEYTGINLDRNYAHLTLENIFRIWQRPVHILTKYDEKEVILSYDGIQHSEGVFKKEPPQKEEKKK
ncbi:MAG: SpoVR family protein [Myxococcota bacterium]